MHERTMWLNARCDALEIALMAHSQEAGFDGKLLGEVIRRAQNQSYSERLLELERTDPALDGRLIDGGSTGEVLSDDGKNCSI